jgi:hypothetical protein
MLALVIQELVLVSTTGAIIDPLLHQIHLYISGAGGPYLRIGRHYRSAIFLLRDL